MPRRFLDALLNLNQRAERARFSRRELLKQGAMAAGALLSGAGAHLCSADTAPGRRVIVIGAGFSGLACAFELASVGYDVKVFEARSRVGGRVLSLKNLIAGKNIEGGGEMVGSNHPDLIAYAAKFQIELLNVTESADPSTTILDGIRIPAADLERAGAEVEAAYAAMNRDARLVNEDEPWKSANADGLDQTSTAAWIDAPKVSELTRKLLRLQFTADNGVATEAQSYLGNLAQVKGGGVERYWTETEVCRLSGGNQQLAFRFAEELGDERVLVGNPVREISATISGMAVVDSRGMRYEADDVVLAIPPSTWSTIKINPALPADLTPQMGANVKYLAVVDTPFWTESMLAPDGRTDGDLNEVWNSTDGQGDAGPVGLTSFSGGPAAERLHRLAVAERQPRIIDDFEAMHPGFGRHFVKGRFMDWIGDPWTRAGYSFPAPGEVTTIGPRLRQGCGRLHFIGEHTNYAFVGYMNEALRSGIHLAKRLAARDGVSV